MQTIVSDVKFPHFSRFHLSDLGNRIATLRCGGPRNNFEPVFEGGLWERTLKRLETLGRELNVTPFFLRRIDDKPLRILT